MRVYNNPMRTSIPESAARPTIKGTPEQIADWVRTAIEEGKLPPGAPLHQAELAAQFGLSRIPVREALRHLEAEGYISYQPNKGANVAGLLPLEELREIIEIRECLEKCLMGHALAQLDDAMLAEAEAALDALNRGTTFQQLYGAHEHFHTVLFRAARRPRMSAIINGWRFRLGAQPDVDGERKRAFAHATRGVHRRLLNACRKQDRAAVSRCVAEEYGIVRAIVDRVRG